MMTSPADEILLIRFEMMPSNAYDIRRMVRVDIDISRCAVQFLISLVYSGA